MAEEESSHQIKLMNFVSEHQLDEAKRTRGERVEDGTAQRDRPLYEILKENKDKKDAEFNERFKHRPPKALDQDETEFLENWEKTRREYEQQVADEEAQQLKSFQYIILDLDEAEAEMSRHADLLAAVAAQSSMVHEVKEISRVPEIQPEMKLVGKKNPATQPLGMIIKVKPQAKKAKLDQQTIEEPSDTSPTAPDAAKVATAVEIDNCDSKTSLDVGQTGLVSYSDESDEDD